MKKALLPIVLLALSSVLQAQPQTFDIATFTPPPGFTRTAANGVLLFESRKQVLLRREFCQIYLFASRPASSARTALHASSPLMVRPPPAVKPMPGLYTASPL